MKAGKFLVFLILALLWCFPSFAILHGTNGIAPLIPSSGVVLTDQNSFPFVNLFKMALLTNGATTTSVYPNNLNVNQLPTGTLTGSIPYFVYLPTNYFGKYVFSVTGTVSGTGIDGIEFATGQSSPDSATHIIQTIYSSTGSPNIIGCSVGASCGSSFITTGTNYSVTFDFSTLITGAANNGSGAVRLSMTNNYFANGELITVAGVLGTDGNGCGANGPWTVANETSTTIDLVGSMFTNACTYTSGGNAYPYQEAEQYNIGYQLNNGTSFSGITAISICKLSDYTTDNTCNTTGGKSTWAGGFNDDFVQKLAALKPKYLRYLDVNGTVFHQPPSYADSATANWFSYNNIDNNYIPAKWFGASTGTNSYAVSCTGTCTYTLTSGAPANGDLIQFYNTNANTTMTTSLTVTDVSSVTSAAIPILGQGATPSVSVIGGTPTTGDTLTYTFTSSCISGGSTTATYTVVGGDTLSSIAANLTSTINNKTALTALPFAAVAQDSFGEILIYYASNGCNLTLTHSISGSATETISTGNMTVGQIFSGTIYTAVYSSLLHSWIINDNDVGTGSNGGGSALQWPWSVQIDLANDVSTASGVSVGCWLQSSLLWSNASFTSLATYAAANPCTGGTWFELSNEVFNFQNLNTPQSQALAASLGFGLDYQSYYLLRIRQEIPIAQTAFSGQLSNLHVVASFQQLNASLSALQGTKLCGTSCGNTAYQTAIGTDYNSGTNEPHNFLTAVSQSPYYAGGMAGGYNYTSSSGYSAWSATNSSVSSNVLTVTGTVTGTIWPNNGISSCDGVYLTTPTPTNWASGQLTGKVTTTLNGAIVLNTNPITLTSVAGLSVGMWVYDQTTGFPEGIIQSINTGANQVTVTWPGLYLQPTLFASKGTNDTMVFGGLAGTYQLNSTTCSASSGTITGGDILGLQYAADNYNGLNGALGSQQDAFNWVYQDSYSGVQDGVLTNATTVQSLQYSYLTLGNIGGYGLPVQDYEGGFSTVYPSTSQATSTGLPSSAYGGATGYIATLINAFKNSSLVENLETLKHSQEIAALPAGSSLSWYVFANHAQFGLFPNTLYYPAPYKDYNAIGCYNGNASLC